MTCPICNAKLVIQGDLREDGSEKCPNGHYYYSHSYSNHETVYDVDGSDNIILSLRHPYDGNNRAAVLKSQLEEAFILYAKEYRQNRAAYLGVTLDEE